MRRAFLFPLVVLLAGLVSINAVENQDLKELEHAKWVKDTLQTLFPVNIVKQISNARSGVLNRTIGTKCSEQVTLLQEGLTKNSIWAMKMIDASSKIPSGILIGNSIDLGMFDECVQINVNEGGQEIRGRHCMYKIFIELLGLSISPTLSICLPALCEPEDVQEIVKNLLEQVLGPVDVNISGATCTAVDPPEWTAGGIVTLTGFSLLLLFLVVCTISEIFVMYLGVKPSPNGRLDILRQFSLYSNAVRVLSTKTSPQTLPALQGIRFFSMCWVIIGHTHIMALSHPTVNLIDAIQWISSWNSLYVVLAPFAVDTFFTISGFLMSYIFLKEMSTGRSFNLFGYYLHRYLRLTPAFVAMILITIFISPRLGSGPIWEENANFEVQACRDRWWTMLLYVHNYVDREMQNCLGHTWYLAVEMQFFWLSPLILYPLAKKPKIGLGILAAFFAASVVTPVKIGYDNKFSTPVISNRWSAGDARSMFDFYFISHTRAAPWLIGILFGYLIFTQKGSSTSKAIKWIGWLLATVAFLFCVFTMRIFQNDDYVYDDVWECFYTAVARPFWAFAISWIMYACIRGFGGPVSTFLSFSIYTPLSRISYCVYLVHYAMQFIKARAARTHDYFSGFNAFDHFLSDLLLSFMIGFVFTLVFESPVLILEKIVKKRRGRTNNDLKRISNEQVVKKGIDNSGLTGESIKH